jgi:hypothetical protein
MNTVFGLNFFVFGILVLVVTMYFTKGVRDEGFEDVKQEAFFGTSPGTMVQLESTRSPFIDVNARPEQKMEDAIQASLTKKALLDMTESGSFDTHYASP